jgi:hypothetical protein
MKSVQMPDDVGASGHADVEVAVAFMNRCNRLSCQQDVQL